MATHLNDQMSQLNIGSPRDINILLLGETGVGKSTFINSFYNYLKHSNLRSAMKDELIVLIPTKFTIMDEDYKQQVVEIGAEKNELIQTGASRTQATRSYVFPIREGNANIRLIDTPGNADTRGIDFDNINFENMLSFIGELEHLNAICILLKPDNSRLTVLFEYCIKQIFSNLNKSACENLIFVMTCTRSTHYRPGETFPALEKLLEGISNVKISLEKKNVFCVDNEAFRFWAAHHNGIKFNSDDIEDFSQSWKKSFLECCRMINYIAGTNDNAPLRPHLVKNTTSVNEARRLILKLSQPLAEIAQLIEDNIIGLQRHKSQLESRDYQIKQLYMNLYIPITNLKITPLKYPATVCTSTKCSEVHEVNHVKKWHYKQVCHSPCGLNGVPKEIIGSPLLANCAAMNGQPRCQQCGCEYQKHMHIYCRTETFEDKLENENVKSEINNQKSEQELAKTKIQKIEEFLDVFKKEKEVILKTTAKFAYFLQTNAITPYNDAYEGYLLYLIDREKSLGAHVDYKAVRVLESMLDHYKEEKRILSNALSMQSDGVNEITAKEVIESVDKLYTLKHNGDKIKQLFVAQNPARVAQTKSEAREGVYVTKGSKNRLNKLWNTIKTGSKQKSKKKIARCTASIISSNIEDGLKENEQTLPNVSISLNVKEDKVLDCRCDVPDISSEPIPENDSQDSKDFDCVCAVSDNISPESVVDDGSENNKNQILSVSSNTPSKLDVKEGPQENNRHILNDSSDTSSESDVEGPQESKKLSRNDSPDTSSVSDVEEGPQENKGHSLNESSDTSSDDEEGQGPQDK